MKHMKKFMALVIAMVMIVAMVVPTMAAEPTSYSVSIVQNQKDTGTHTYGAYKIFKGNLDNGTLSNLDWADNLDITDAVAENIATALNITDTDAKDAKKVADALKDLGFNADKAKAFAEAIEPLLTTPEQTVTGAGNVTIEGLTGGYYLIKDTTNPTVSDGQYASQTKFILSVTKPVTTVNVKSSVPSVVKKVEDKADSTSATGSYGDSADHDIGDTFHYTLTATLGAGVDNYKQYYLKFKDTMCNGLTYGEIESVIVDYDGNLATTTDQVNITGSDDSKKEFTQTGTATIKATDGTTDLPAKVYELEIKDLFTETGVVRPTVVDDEPQPGATEGTIVVVTYTATLNENAQIGKPGNPNDVSLIYGSNPNYEGEGTPTEETPKDRNVVFTYKTVVNKVQPNPDYDPEDDESEPYISLDKAGFTLYKEVTADYVARNDEIVKTGSEIKAEFAATSVLTTDIVAANKYVVISSAETAGASATFTFKGLDDGKYVLVETTVPAGFNAFDSVQFTISATHETEDSADPQLTALNGITADSQSNVIVLEGEQNGTVNLPAGEIDTDVINNKGSVLPSTGGIGTTIFYAIGAILVVGAGIVLVTRRRMSAN